MIKRYEVVVVPGTVVQQSGDGYFVTHKDHAAEVARLNEQVQALAAERDASRKVIAEIYTTVIGEQPGWSNWHAYLDDIVEEVGNAIRAGEVQP